MPDPTKLPSIRRAATRTERRMRLFGVVRSLPTSLTMALGVVGVALAVHKLWPHSVPESWTWAVVIGAGLSVIATVAFGWLRQLPPHAGAMALDRHHGLHGRLTNALELSSLPVDQRSAMVEAAIDDAAQTVSSLEPRAAVLIPFPSELLVSVGVAAAVAVVSLLEVAHRRELPEPPKAATFVPLEVADDDLDLIREDLERLKQESQSAEVQEAIERFNALVEDIAERRLNRTEAFRKMQEIKSDLLKGVEADDKALDDALQQTAKELANSPLSKPIADALKKNDLSDAAKEAKKLAERLDKGNKPSKAQLERLRKALDRAAKNKKKALDEINEQRAALRQDLLKNKKKDKDTKPKTAQEQQRDKRLLNKKKRQLERLDREAKRRERAQRRLSRLDRDLAKAAADLLREMGASAEDMEKVAEDLNRLEQEQLSDKEKQELRKRLDEMRELIRQQGQGGEKNRQRLRRFLRRAKGGKGGKGQRGQGGKNRQPGQEGKGQGKQGQGQGQGQGSGEFVIGPGGKKIPVEVPGGSGQGEGEGDRPGEGAGEGGKKWGTGSGGDPKGKHTDIAGENVDVRAEAVDTKQGPSNAEVILSAAERGFTGKPYKNVYKQYRTVAEDQIDTEKIPDGMRFYVRRYFNLIRPRE